jgi:hypothetical protein
MPFGIYIRVYETSTLKCKAELHDWSNNLAGYHTPNVTMPVSVL